jgi:hypothetical protein
MLKTIVLMIITAALSIPVGILIWGLSPISPGDALSGGTTTYLMMHESIILMGITVLINATILISIERLLRRSTISPSIPLTATGLQGLMIGFSFGWIPVAASFETNYTGLIFIGLVLAAHTLFFVAMLFLFGSLN